MSHVNQRDVLRWDLLSDLARGTERGGPCVGLACSPESVPGPALRSAAVHWALAWRCFT